MIMSNTTDRSNNINNMRTKKRPLDLAAKGSVGKVTGAVSVEC